jgi:hypothetical protein
MGGGNGLAELVVLAVDDEQPAPAELVHLLGIDQRLGSVVPALGAAGVAQALRTCRVVARWRSRRRLIRCAGRRR